MSRFIRLFFEVALDRGDLLVRRTIVDRIPVTARPRPGPIANHWRTMELRDGWEMLRKDVDTFLHHEQPAPWPQEHKIFSPMALTEVSEGPQELVTLYRSPCPGYSVQDLLRMAWRTCWQMHADVVDLERRQSLAMLCWGDEIRRLTGLGPEDLETEAVLCVLSEG